jgi:hypothetical protein
MNEQHLIYNEMRKKSCNLILFSFLMFLIISCDGTVGEKGMVQDESTGERIEGVKVTLNSHYDDVVDSTNVKGYFYLFDDYSCGIKKCDDSFTMTFEKDGYETFKINERYSSSSQATFVRDTLVIELVALESER